MESNTRLVLAGDVGGTKTELAIYQDGDCYEPLVRESFASASYCDLESMVREFLASKGLVVRRAAFGVAGPVLAGRAKITKLDWVVDRQQFLKTFELEEVAVVNDLVATAHGIAALPTTDLVTLNQGQRVEHGPLAVIAAGTGLGEALMFWDGHRYQACATEGGHAFFSPASREHLALASYLHDLYGPVSFDFLASGRGLPLIYDFLLTTGPYEAPAWLVAAMAVGDPSPAIARAALDPGGASPLCLAAVRILVELLAVESANLALKTLSTGGLYLGGGIPPKLAPLFEKHFMATFLGHRQLREILAAMPVYLIMNPQTALLGAARLAMAS